MATERRSRVAVEERRNRTRPPRQGKSSIRQADTSRGNRGPRRGEVSRSRSRSGEPQRASTSRGGAQRGTRRDRNPFESPTTRSYSRRPQPNKKNIAGLISFGMGLGSILCFVIIAVIMASMVNSVMHGNEGQIAGSLGFALFLGIMIWVLCIGGVISGIIGVVAKGRSKGFAITGLAISGGVFLLLLISTISRNA